MYTIQLSFCTNKKQMNEEPPIKHYPVLYLNLLVLDNPLMWFPT